MNGLNAKLKELQPTIDFLIVQQEARGKASAKLLSDFPDYTDSQKIEQFASKNILRDQTDLINDCLGKGVLDYDDIQNLYAGECDESEYDQKEIFNWYLVSYSFAHALAKKGEVIIESDENDSTWWGRTTFGQAIYMDSVVGEIFSESLAA